MTAINISVARSPLNGKLQGSYEAVADGVNFIGAIGHGNELTITDSLARFGTRENVKPFFVNLGDSFSGNALGRDTAAHLNTNATIDGVVKLGGFSSSLKFNIREYGNSGIISAPITLSTEKPIIQYIERREQFNYNDPQIQCNGYYFSNFGSSNTRVFTITIDGVGYTHTNDGTPASIGNSSTVATTIADLINLDSGCPVTAVANDGTFGLKLTKKSEINYSIIVTYNENCYQNFNNKQARIWSWNDATPNNARLSITNGTTSLLTVENTTGSTAGSYPSTAIENTWLCEELVFRNSNAPDTADGFYYHYRDSKILNTSNSLVTYNTGQQRLGRCYLNQFSNGPYGYWRTELIMHFGYQCWDDEYTGVYLADSATITDNTKKVRQPQTFWTENRIKIYTIESHVPAAGAHVHLRTGLSTFIYMGQIPS